MNILPYTQTQAEEACEAWGCNCGPAALAAVLNIGLEAVRPIVEAAGFGPGRRYMNPTMMERAIAAAGARIVNKNACGHVYHGLCRIQWAGPWTKPSSNPRWAYRHTHWIAAWASTAGRLVFDINGGLMPWEQWEAEVVPVITSQIPRADGDWFFTHKWEIKSP